MFGIQIKLRMHFETIVNPEHSWDHYCLLLTGGRCLEVINREPKMIQENGVRSRHVIVTQMFVSLVLTLLQ